MIEAQVVLTYGLIVVLAILSSIVVLYMEDVEHRRYIQQYNKKYGTPQLQELDVKAYMEYTNDDNTFVLEADGEVIKEIEDFPKAHLEIDGKRISTQGWHWWHILTQGKM